MLRRANTDRKWLALTFDDGPDPRYTPRLLELFRAYDAKATFFVLGEALERRRELAAAIVREGHELGNHTYGHPDLTTLSESAIRLEAERAAALLRDVSGETPRLFRPPFLAYDDRVAAVCEELGYTVVGGVNTETRDWDMPGVDHIVSTVLEAAENGSIIFLHDSGGDRSQTVAAVERLLPALVEEGYRLVTVGELLAGANGGDAVLQ